MKDNQTSGKKYPKRSSRQVITFLTNKMDQVVIAELHNLEEQIGDLGDVKVLYHQSDKMETTCFLDGTAVFLFSNDVFNELGYQTFLSSKLDGSNHFPLIKFFRQNPYYDYYWYMEDDVRCLQGWGEFFRYFLENEIFTDFLSSHIRDLQDEPHWHWWNSLKRQPDPIAIDLVRSFNPIFRISRSALRFIDQCHQDGWSGHFEVLLPSLLKSAGFSIAEFGGKGRYVLPGCENLFYTAAEPHSAGILSTGSMRYRPLIRKEEMNMSIIYHPVKDYNAVL